MSQTCTCEKDLVSGRIDWAVARLNVGGEWVDEALVYDYTDAVVVLRALENQALLRVGSKVSYTIIPRHDDGTMCRIVEKNLLEICDPKRTGEWNFEAAIEGYVEAAESQAIAEAEQHENDIQEAEDGAEEDAARAEEAAERANSRAMDKNVEEAEGI